MKAVLLLLLLVVNASLFGQVDLKKLDAYYAKAQKDWGVPGMSIAIVKDGKILFAKGYGTKELGKNEVPDENTLYAIASNSKAFTAFAIGQLVDEGKLSWDDKVIDYLPWFRLSEPWMTEETTIRDLLSHRTGLGTFSGDLSWYRSSLSAEELVKRIQYLKPVYSYRAGYGYSNVMFVTAGEVMRKVTGQSWGERIAKDIFQPLGMSRSLYTSKGLEKMGNYATPHNLVEKQHHPIPWEDWETIAAMGGIISSVRDMSQWMILHLNKGIINGDTLLTTAQLNTVWTPHNPFAVNHFDARGTSHFSSYGLGWFVGDYRGRMRVGHTGGYTGMLSAVALLPEENLGVVVLTNGMVPVYGPLVNYTLDAFLKVPVRDWSNEGRTRYAERLAKDTRVADRKKARITGTRPSVKTSDVTGVYFTPAYGSITVRDENGKLRISFEHTPDLSATLEHWHYDTYELKWDKDEMLAWFSFGTVKFTVDNNAKVTGITFDVPNDDFLFEEMNATKIK